MNTAIFWPMVAQVALTLGVTWRMYRRRIAEMRGRRIPPQGLATRAQAGRALEDAAAADNYQNLFEAPVLFYVVCLALAITSTASGLQVGLAWSFVVLRATHSFIHTTYNRVIHRFVAFVSSISVLVAMWALFAYSLLTAR